jgi:hypothetical protein
MEFWVRLVKVYQCVLVLLFRSRCSLIKKLLLIMGIASLCVRHTWRKELRILHYCTAFSDIYLISQWTIYRNLACCDIYEKGWYSCFHRASKNNLGSLDISITTNRVDLCNVFGLSRESKQNATSRVIFMLCCPTCRAVHYKLLMCDFPVNVTIIG